MTDLQRASIQRVVEAWRRAAPVLEAVRKEDIRRSDTANSISAFAGLVLEKVKPHPPGPDSGLIDQQRLFRRFHSRQ